MCECPFLLVIQSLKRKEVDAHTLNCEMQDSHSVEDVGDVLFYPEGYGTRVLRRAGTYLVPGYHPQDVRRRDKTLFSSRTTMLRRPVKIILNSAKKRFRHLHIIGIFPLSKIQNTNATFRKKKSVFRKFVFIASCDNENYS